MCDSIIVGTEFDANDIRYTAPKLNKSGGKSINIIRKSTGRQINLLTPMFSTWGASDFINKETGEGNGQYEMALRFPPLDCPENNEAKSFHDAIKKLEDKVKQDAFDNAKEWFGKTFKSLDVVDALFNRCLKFPKTNGEIDYTQPPTIRIKLPQWQGTWKCLLFDEDQNKLYPNSDTPDITPVDIIKPNSNIISIIQCNGIWIVNGNFGFTWKLIQGMVHRSKPSIYEQCFIKINPADREKLKTIKATNESDDNEINMVVSKKSDSNERELVVDTDDECEEEEKDNEEIQQETVVEQAIEQPEPEPVEQQQEPEPEAKKRIVRKKKT
jgi:hypothetical protein